MTMEHRSTPLSEREKAEAFDGVQKELLRISDIGDRAVQKVTTDLYGANTYYRAQGLLHPPDMGELPDDIKELSDSNWEKACEELARDRLSLEPEDEIQAGEKMRMLAWARSVFPDETLLSLLDDPEKLALIGSEHLKMELEDNIDTHPDVAKLLDVQADIGNYIEKEYTKIISEKDGSIKDESLDVTCDELGIFIAPKNLDYPVTMTGAEKLEETLRKTITVKLVEGELFLNGEPIANHGQLAEIKTILGRFSRVADKLESLFLSGQSEAEPT